MDTITFVATAIAPQKASKLIELLRPHSAGAEQLSFLRRIRRTGTGTGTGTDTGTGTGTGTSMLLCPATAWPSLRAALPAGTCEAFGIAPYEVHVPRRAPRLADAHAPSAATAVGKRRG